mgnify:CR=1 FL=1
MFNYHIKKLPNKSMLIGHNNNCLLRQLRNSVLNRYEKEDIEKFTLSLKIGRI